MDRPGAGAAPRRRPSGGRARVGRTAGRPRRGVARRSARASGCVAELRLEKLPLAAGLRRGYRDWDALALGGGEDFELLAAAPPEVLATVMATWPAELAPLTVVGVLREGSAGV